MGQKTKSAIDIEKLLAKKNQITNAALNSALKKLEEKKKEEQEETLIANLEYVDHVTNEAVELLRGKRAEEKKAKAYLTSVCEAQDKFYSDGDYKSYLSSVSAAVTEYSKRT
jgi:hypothetical protein